MKFQVSAIKYTELQYITHTQNYERNKELQTKKVLYWENDIVVLFLVSIVVIVVGKSFLFSLSLFCSLSILI